MRKLENPRLVTFKTETDVYKKFGEYCEKYGRLKGVSLTQLMKVAMKEDLFKDNEYMGWSK